MNEQEREHPKNILRSIGIHKPHSLVEHEQSDDPYPLESIVPHLRLFESVFVDIERYVDVLKAKMAKQDGIAGKVSAIYEHATILSQVEKASRFTNSVKTYIGSDDGEAGKFRKACHENANHADHGRKHERIFRKGMKWLLLMRSHLFLTESDAFSLKQENKDALRYDQMRVAAPYVLMRVSDTHDEPQLHAAIWNDDFKDKADHIRPKDMHELFAGLLAVLDEGKYKKARGYDDGRARLIGNMLLFTVIGHGEPTTYLKSVSATEKAYSKTDAGTIEIPDEDLFRLADSKENLLDWTSISRSQFLKIIQHNLEVGRANGKVLTFDTPSGLHPLLHDFFAHNGGFEKLQNDHEPMFLDILPEERQLLLEMRRMVLVVDLGEMVLPPIEAGLRKVIVKKSEERKIFDAVNPLGDGFDVEAYVKQLQSINGHECKSDFERTFFEEFQYMKMVKDCGLLDDPSTKDIFSDLLVDAFCGAYWTMDQLMNPELTHVEDGIRTMFNVQVYDLISKALQKNHSGVKLNWSEIVKRGWLVESSDDLLKRFSTYFNLKDYIALEKRVKEYTGLQEKTIKVVTHKWNKSAHSEDERINQVLVFQAMAYEFASKLDISPEVIYKKFSEWQSGNLYENIRRSKMPWVSMGAYMGKPEDAKLI